MTHATSSNINRDILAEGMYFIAIFPSGAQKVLKVQANQFIQYGRFGDEVKVPMTELIGKPYGSVFNVECAEDRAEESKSAKGTANKNYKLVPVAYEELMQEWLVEAAEEQQQNKEIIDDASNQALDRDDITLLRQDVKNTTDLIKIITENNASFDKKNDYNKQKYIKKKQSKFAKTIKIVKPDAYTLCDFNSDKSPNKVRNLKADIISVLLEKSNVMNGSNVILVDDSAGILSFAVLDRIGDSGEVLFVTNSEGVDQGLPNLKYYPRPLPKHHSLSWTNIRAGVLGNEYWEDLDKKIEETNAKITENEVAMEEQTEENNPPGQPKRMKTYTDRQKAMKKSKEFVENSRIDALIISSNYSCDGILDVFGKYLSPSRLLIIHANYVEELYDTYMRLRNDKNYINVNISENFTRYYQIYPKRTHAENNMTSATGFILTAIKVDGSKSVCVDDLMG